MYKRQELTIPEKLKKIYKIVLVGHRIQVREIVETGIKYVGISVEHVCNILHEHLCTTNLCAR